MIFFLLVCRYDDGRYPMRGVPVQNIQKYLDLLYFAMDGALSSSPVLDIYLKELLSDSGRGQILVYSFYYRLSAHSCKTRDGYTGSVTAKTGQERQGIYSGTNIGAKKPEILY